MFNRKMVMLLVLIGGCGCKSTTPPPLFPAGSPRLDRVQNQDDLLGADIEHQQDVIDRLAKLHRKGVLPPDALRWYNADVQSAGATTGVKGYEAGTTRLGTYFWIRIGRSYNQGLELYRTFGIDWEDKLQPEQKNLLAQSLGFVYNHHQTLTWARKARELGLDRDNNPDAFQLLANDDAMAAEGMRDWLEVDEHWQFFNVMLQAVDDSWLCKANRRSYRRGGHTWINVRNVPGQPTVFGVSVR